MALLNSRAGTGYIVPSEARGQCGLSPESTANRVFKGVHRREKSEVNGIMPISAWTLILLSPLLAACRQDMHDQPRYKPLAAANFFGDGRSARPVVEGTVARGHLRIDSAMYTGKVDGKEIDYFPIPIARADLARGQQRFNIYCSPCHSRVGDGNGMIVRRGFRQAASYHTEKLLKAPTGHFFDVMSNGFGAMPSYASRVEPADRWRIAAYIRVLQLSRRATLAEVPPDQRGDVDKGPLTPQEKSK